MNLSAGFLTFRRAASWGAMSLLLAAPEGRNHWEGNAGLVGGISFLLGGPGIPTCSCPISRNMAGGSASPGAGKRLPDSAALPPSLLPLYSVL